MRILKLCSIILVLQSAYSVDYSDNACSESDSPSINCSLSRIFNTYGSVSEINYEGFEHLLEHVHASDYFFNHSLTDHKDNASETFVPRHLSHNHGPVSQNDENSDGEEEEDAGEEPTDEKCCPCNGDSGENTNEHNSHKHIERKRFRRKRETGEEIEVPTTMTPRSKCFSPGEIMASVQLSTDDRITPTTFKDLCPIILDQIDRGTCLTNPVRIKKSKKGHGAPHEEASFAFPPLYVWLIALGAVFTISLLGFLIVAALPLMYTVFYNHLQQFLVAMAVGTLSGDAILHLIPHAFFPHRDGGEEGDEAEDEEHENSQRQLIYFGTLILVGILILYVIEQIINIFPQQMEKKRLEKEREKYKQQYSSPPRIYLSASNYYVGEKLGNPHTHEHDEHSDDDDHHSGVFPTSLGRSTSRAGYSERNRFCYPFYGSCNDIVFRLQSRSRNNLLVNSASRPFSVGDTPSDAEGPESVRFLPRSSGSLDHHQNRRALQASTLPSNLPSSKKQVTKPEQVSGESSDETKKASGHNRSNSHGGHGHNHSYHKHETHGRQHAHGHSHSHGHSHGAPKPKASAEPSSSGHGHSHGKKQDAGHGHGHSHDHEDKAPESSGHGHGHGHGDGSCTGTAMMVAFADIFHNFIDGMAIGAAFTQRLAGGLSTSIAVTLHELPHEMGDFALLLQEGLSIKRGLALNALSSVVCLIGVALGVGLGSIPMFNQFIFSVAAGMFLYVSLVTMLPQVSSIKTKPDENPYRHLAYQLFGMLCGIGLMFLIALYEERLQDAIKKVVIAAGLTL